MVTIGEINNEDIIKWQEAFQYAQDKLGGLDGYFFKVIYNGQEKLLLRKDDTFNLFDFNEKGLSMYRAFKVDNNYELSEIGLQEYLIWSNYGIAIFEDRLTHNTEILSADNYVDGPDEDGYNGLVVYAQYDPIQDIRVHLVYRHNFYENNSRIYPTYLLEPMRVIIEKKTDLREKGIKLPGTRQAFIKRTFDYEEEPHSFTIATIKDHGLKKVLDTGALQIQGTNTFSRYYREIKYDKKTSSFICSFPFGSQYTFEEIVEYLESLGFKTSIPEELIDYYNDDNPMVKEYREIASHMKKVETEPNYDSEKPVVLKLALDNGENSNGNN